MASLAGKLLVASPVLVDPNFARTVVFLLSHTEDGAFGVVVNRPSDAAVRDYLPAWTDVVSRPAVLFHGGPVDRASAIAVTYEATRLAAEGAFAHGYALADLDLGPDALLPLPDRVRVFLGYAGWGAGQLDGEVDQGGWVVVDGRAEDVFCDEPAALWSRVLKRQGGEAALLAHFPRDPRAN